MSELPVQCARFDELVSGLIEAEIGADARHLAESHAATCPRCRAQIDELRALVIGANRLPQLSPGRDLWAGIEARIQAPVIDLAVRGVAAATEAGPDRFARNRVRSGRLRRLGVVAAALVLLSSGVTYVATRASMNGEQPPVPAQSQAGPLPAAPRLLPGRPLISGASDVPGGSLDSSLRSAFGEQIAMLQALLAARRSSLDSGTMAVLDRNMAYIDDAIEQSIAALSHDPSSAFLADRYRSALSAKVGLLRTAVMLRPVADK